jgi:predicted alpha/beta-fold hydrolase
MVRGPFKPTAFAPAWWLRGRHRQTIGGRYLRPRRGVALRRRRIETPDGDFLDLDFADALLPPETPLVLVLHGLEGSARSGYAVETYRRLRAAGIAAVGLNFRSCGGEPNLAPRLYHSGETGDVGHVIESLVREFPGRPLAAIGFSLGGNVLLKYLGEQGAAAPLRAAAAISVPFDLAAGARALEKGMGRIYTRTLLWPMQRKVAHRAAQLRPLVDVEAGLAAASFWQFDDAITAPLHGFADASDYYARSSCSQFLPDIRVPTRLLHARDDPFMPVDEVPQSAVGNPLLAVTLSERGGHVGFINGALPWRPRFWAEAEAVRFVAWQLASLG